MRLIDAANVARAAYELELVGDISFRDISIHFCRCRNSKDYEDCYIPVVGAPVWEVMFKGNNGRCWRLKDRLNDPHND